MMRQADIVYKIATDAARQERHFLATYCGLSFIDAQHQSDFVFHEIWTSYWDDQWRLLTEEITREL